MGRCARSPWRLGSSRSSSSPTRRRLADETYERFLVDRARRRRPRSRLSSSDPRRSRDRPDPDTNADQRASPTRGPTSARRARARRASRSRRPRGATAIPARALAPSPSRAGPRDVFERIDDAAEVHRLTGTAPAVALHFPWDAVDDLGALREHAERPRAAGRRDQPEPVPGPRLPARLDHNPDAADPRQGASTTCWSACRSPPSSAATAQSLWFADGTNYPGQDDLRARRRRLDGRPWPSCTRALPADQELLLEYKLFEPAFYATDLADWGSAMLRLPAARRARPRARRPRPPRAGRQRRADRGAARRRGPARRLSLQQPQVRRRRPDRRLGEPVRAVPDLLRAGRAAAGRYRA